MTDRLRVFGIRHHGPGSARRLRAALEDWQPDVVVIELAADAEKALLHVLDPDLRPPLALVSYNDKNLRHASYLPFAVFSPEWQAIHWAVHHDVPVRAMDLPVANSLALSDDQPAQLTLPMPEDPIPQRLLLDPLGYIARLAGETDGERWWETTFEKEAQDTDTFSAILQLMQTLRAEVSGRERPATLRREAYMRKVLRSVLKEDFARIAVVCGAWHAPVLVDWASYKSSADNLLLRGLPKIKVKITWIPWSYERLSRQSGYGAGVHSPAWYAMLFDRAEEAVTHWMVAAARLLREEGFDVSPAHAQEAVRLARNLAALRAQSVPGLHEMREAALATLTEGQPERMALIERKLILGDAVGEVPADIPSVPLQADLSTLLKSSRLNKYWGKTGKIYVKETKSQPRGGIDLREPTDLLKSHLLHQLGLLQLPWATLHTDSERALGSFREIWRLDWQPEINLLLLEAARYGPTVREAAAARVLEKASEALPLAALTQLTLDSLRAGLPDLMPQLTARLRETASLTTEGVFLLQAIPGLVDIIRYGDSRRTDTTALAVLVREVTPRMAIGLPQSLSGIDIDVASTYLPHLLATQRAYSNLGIDELTQFWEETLNRLSRHTAVHPLLRGGATRLLLDADVLNSDTIVTRFRYALSGGHGPDAIAHYLEGFLTGSGLLLLYHPFLLELVDTWITELSDTIFQRILPLLRRAFSNFSGPEREKLLAKIKDRPAPNVSFSPDASTSDRSADEDITTLLATLEQWMG